MALAGEAALGYICTTFHATGTDFPLIQEILKHVYAGGKGPGPASDVATDQALVRPLGRQRQRSMRRTRASRRGRAHRWVVSFWHSFCFLSALIFDTVFYHTFFMFAPLLLLWR
jgi:hypothetical protein